MISTVRTIIISVMAAFLAGCSVSSDRFKIDARFLNMNQADFYVYSPDGVMDGVDTIHVMGGRFTYEKNIMQDEGIVVIVFPNYSSMPVFVEKGGSISIDANAAKLKDMDITGTDANEDYTEWRKNTMNMSPLEKAKQAELFITEHPASPVSRWLVMQHFIVCQKPNFKKATELLKLMQKASDSNMRVTRLMQAMSKVGQVNVGDRLPRFSGVDIDGKPVTNGEMLNGNTAVCVWATWNYDSQSQLRQLAYQQRSETSTHFDKVVTICLDASISECRKTLRNCNAENLTTICDTMMWESPLVKAFGVTNVPFNLKMKNGKVTHRCVPSSELTKL